METDLIVRYLAEEVNHEEKAKVEKLLATDDDFRDNFNAIQKYWHNADHLGNSFDPDIKKAFEQVRAQTIDKTPTKTRMLQPFYLTGYAAAILILVTFGMILSDDLSDTVLGTQTYRTEQEISRIELLDGSIIWLNRGSRLQVSRDFNENQRKVFLQGEAFFEVQRDESSPFIIDAGDTQTQVLGTSFNIRCFDKTGDVKITVASGKVSFAAQNINRQPLILEANDVGHFISNRQQLITSTEAQNSQAWKNRDFRFDNTPLNQVLTDLSHGYGQEILFEESQTKGITFSGNFSDLPLQKILEIIEATLDISFIREGDKIRLKEAAAL